MRIAVLILLLLLDKYSSGQIHRLEGKVLDLDTKKPLKHAEVLLLTTIPLDNKDSVEFFWRKIYSLSGTLLTEPCKTKKVTKRVFTDEAGYFHFADVDTPYQIVCSYQVKRPTDTFIAYHDDNRYADSLEIVNNETKGLYFIKASCPFDKTSNLPNCPKCKKGDMIQPIFWGVPVYSINGDILDGNGKVINVDDVYFGGCDISWCMPRKHCKRCNLNF